MRMMLLWCLALFPLSNSWASDDLCGETFTSPEALEVDIKSRSQVKILTDDPATVASYLDDATGIVWNFAKPANKSYPSVACRKLVAQDGAYSVSTSIRCGAAKVDCDELAKAYSELDRQMREDIERRKR